MSTLIQEHENKQIKRAFEGFSPGDTVAVQVKVREGDRERLQSFEGTVIAKRNRGLQSSFTVRKISHGTAVERVFPFHSPLVIKVKKVRSGKVRRAKLYYLRGRTGKAARVKSVFRQAQAQQEHTLAPATAQTKTPE